MTRSIARAAGAFLFVGTALLAQAPPPSAPAPQGSPDSPARQAPVFRSGVDLVRLDLRVTDAGGRPVRDIRPDEIEISEGGSPRPVLLFQRVEQPHGTYADAAQRTIAAEVSTNQGAPRGQVYVLVFDQGHILPGNEQRARLAVDRFLRTAVRPGDRVALYALPGPGPQIEFTGDLSRVRGELRAVRGSGEETGFAVLGPMRYYEAYEVTRGNQAVTGRLAEAYLQARQSANVSFTRQRGLEDPSNVREQVLDDARTLVARADGESRRLLTALSDVIGTLRQVDGRKSVILFSEGFEVDNLGHELEAVAAAAAQSFAVVYAMHIGPAGVSAGEEAPRGGEALMERRSRTQSLGSLAGETDGALIADADAQLDASLAQIAAASQDYYLVGFAPAKESADGSYRRVEVRVKRPGVRVNARRGYAMGPAPTPADRRAALDRALRAPFSQQGLKVEYTTYVLRGTSPDAQRVLVSLAADLPIDDSADRKQQAEIVFAVRDVADGRIVASGSDTIPLPTARRPGDTVGAGAYRVQFEVPAGTYLMRAVVREPGGLLGSADRRFQVRGLRGPGVTASDLVLGSADARGLPVKATAYTAEALPAAIEVYGASAAQLAGAAVAIELLPLGSSVAVTTARAELAEAVPAGRAFSREARVVVPLGGVAPGDYLVRAVVRDGAETVADLTRDVRILAGSPPPPSSPAPPNVDPQQLFGGEVAHRYLAALRARLAGGPLGAAATAAEAGKWMEVERALPAGSPRAGDLGLLEGLAALGRGEYPRAVQALGPALRTSAPQAELAFLLGWAHVGAGDDRGAVSAWRSAILADRTLVPAYLAIADAYLRLGNAGLARQVIASGLQALPGSPELLDRLSRLGPG